MIKFSNILSILLLALVICLCQACSSEKTDEFLLEKDKKELEKNLYSTKVHTYKLGKICIRASIAGDTISPEFKSFKSKLDNIFNIVVRENDGDPRSLSVTDYITIYRDYQAMSDFIEDTDEDLFPTLTEALNVAYSKDTTAFPALLTGKEKINAQNMEHAVLSALVLVSADMGKEVSLYECAKTNPGLLEEGELKSLLQLFRGFVFLEKKLLYLSEQELSDNIDWLNKHRDVTLPTVKAIFKLQNSTSLETYLYYHSINHLFRGLNRMMMDREIDDKRSMEDFLVFIDNAKKLGLSNELTWSVETYVYTKQEDRKKAIVSLQKLKGSDLLSTDDKKDVDEAIAYLQKREKGAALNSVTDKYFLSKIAGKYMYRVLSAMNWEKILEENKVSHTKEILGTIKAFKNLADNVRKYTDVASVEETGKKMQDQGKGLWNKTKDLLK